MFLYYNISFLFIFKINDFLYLFDYYSIELGLFFYLSKILVIKKINVKQYISNNNNVVVIYLVI